MFKITFSIVWSCIISTLAANEAVSGNQRLELSKPETTVQTPKIKPDPIQDNPSLSEEQKAQYAIMGLTGSYFGVIDQKDQQDSIEQITVIEAARKEMAHQSLEKRPSAFTSKTLESEKVFGASHIAAALSIIQVHSQYLTKKMPGTRFVGWGGGFMHKINRIEMLYASDNRSVSSELYALLLSSAIGGINCHEERFGPYLATYPVSSEEYELRFMLPAYNTLSERENPKVSFIFNIGETVFFCHREMVSKKLQIYKKEQLGDIMKRALEAALKKS